MYNKRIVKEVYKDLKEISNAMEGIHATGSKIVLTQGTFDLLHIGHARYLQEAKKMGDFLIVGVDDDEKVKTRKGPDRPIVPDTERVEMLTHLKYVDTVFLKTVKAPKWSLIKAVKPDILVATKETYNAEQVNELKKFCGKVVVLDPKATTSTSAKIRRMQIGTAIKMEQLLTPKILGVIEETLNEMKK